MTAGGDIESIALFDEASPVANPAFDITPSRYVTALITEHGIVEPNGVALKELRARIGRR